MYFPTNSTAMAIPNIEQSNKQLENILFNILLPKTMEECRMLSQPPSTQIPLTQIPNPDGPHFVPSITLSINL